MVCSPSPVSLTSFVYIFTTAWAYSTGAALAFIELGDSAEFGSFGLMLTLLYTLFLSIFIFGLCAARPLVLV